MGSILNAEIKLTLKDVVQVAIVTALAVTAWLGMASRQYVNEQDALLSKRIETVELTSKNTEIDLAVIKYALGVDDKREKEIRAEIARKRIGQ